MWTHVMSENLLQLTVLIVIVAKLKTGAGSVTMYFLFFFKRLQYKQN